MAATVVSGADVSGSADVCEITVPAGPITEGPTTPGFCREAI